MVQIITDSAADFEPHELEKLNIFCIPMNIIFGDKNYRENENITKSEFYELLKSNEEFPKTSQPSPSEFEEHLNKFKAEGDECVIITISSALSGTYQAILLLKDMVEYDSCYVIDSLNATAGQRMLVEHAVKLRDEGKSAQEIANYLEELKGRIRLMAFVDTLEYLYKGGRLSKAAYTVGSMVNIKPVIKVSDKGKVEVCSKALSIRQGIRSICDTFSKINLDTSYPIYVVYSHNRKNADILVKHLNDKGYEIPEDRIVNIGATIGAHVGTNVCGYICVEKEN
ncbi:MAG: DegV family protein [Eubacteriales bacterium]|nr:DegV family protein [Eubacteriales bacterium]